MLFFVAIVLAVARVVGAVFRRVGLPPVIGEVVAGLLLGPVVHGSDVTTRLLRLGEPQSDDAAGIGDRS